MKTNRYNHRYLPWSVKLLAAVVVAVIGIHISRFASRGKRATKMRTPAATISHPTPSREGLHSSKSEPGHNTNSGPRQRATAGDSAQPMESGQRALALLRQMLNFIGNGPAFDAKVRETVWASGRVVVGVGTYQQSGGGSGQYNLQITMHDGDGKHRLQQISDGKLAWTRTEIAGAVSLRRVDVGRLEEWLRGIAPSSGLSPRLKVGAWGELLSTIERDYALRISAARLKLSAEAPAEPMRVLIGDLKPQRRSAILESSQRQEWPFLYPTRVHVVVKAAADDDSYLTQFIPARIEFWSDPVAAGDAAGPSATQRRLITLIEIYSLRAISPPPAERFRFENKEADVNFVNETDRYVEAHGVNLTQRQRRQLYR